MGLKVRFVKKLFTLLVITSGLSMTGCSGFKSNVISGLNSESSQNSLQIQSPKNGDFVSSNFQVSGTCAGDHEVTLEIGSTSNQVACTNNQFSFNAQISDADGLLLIQASQNDLNSEYRKAINLIKDTLAPEIQVMSPQDDDVFQDSFVLNGFCEEYFAIEITVGDQAYSTDCVDNQFTNTIPLAMGDGEVEVVIAQSDRAKNKREVRKKIRKDKKAPQISITSPELNAEVTNQQIQMTGICEGALPILVTGDLQNAPISLNCSQNIFSLPLVFTSEQGTKNISILHTDLAGNSTQISHQVSFLPISTPGDGGPIPSVTILSPQDGGLVNSDRVILQGTCTKEYSVMVSGNGITQSGEVACDNSSFATTVTLSNGDGAKSIQVTQTDSNQNVASDSVTLVRDTQAPNLTIISPTPNTYISNQINIRGGCEENLPVDVSGTSISTTQVQCQFDSYQINLLVGGNDGQKTFQVRQTDPAGNQSTQSVSVTKDSMKPQLSFTSPKNGDTFTVTQITVSGSCESGLNVRVGGTGLKAIYQFPCSQNQFQGMVNLSDGIGSKPLIIQQTDPAGNQGSAQISVEKIDAIPTLTGEQLYATNCSSCHGILENSAKKDKTSEDIMGAINTIGAMSHLSTLSAAEIDRISDALQSDQVDLACAQSSIDTMGESPTRRLLKPEIEHVYESLFGSSLVSSSAGQSAFNFLVDESVEIKQVEEFPQVPFTSALGAAEAFVDNVVMPNLSTVTGSVNCSSYSTACSNWLINFVERAFRRPLSSNEQSRWALFYEELGFALTMKRALVSPQLLTHLELGSSTVTASGLRQLTPYELASRIAFQTTSFPPDTTLLDAARSGQLGTKDQVLTQVRRLLNTPKGKAHVYELIRNWIGLEGTFDPSPAIANYYQISRNNFGSESSEELNRFIDYIVYQKGGSLQDLLLDKTAFPFTSRLARSMGMSQSNTPQQYSDVRGGLLLRPATLVHSSNAPNIVGRGLRIRRNILCDEIGEPPTDDVIEQLAAVGELPAVTYTNRQILSIKTEPALCMSCHAKINPLGFSMETIDPFGVPVNVEKVFDADGNIETQHSINSSVDDVEVDTSQGAQPSSSPQQTLNYIVGTPKLNHCFSEKVFEMTRLHRAGDYDKCNQNQMASALNNDSVMDNIVRSIANDDIFWKK